MTLGPMFHEQPAQRQRLRCVRLDGTVAPGDPYLGAMVWGPPAAGGPGEPARVEMPLLWPPSGRVDVWHSSAPEPVRQGHSGAVRWRDDGHWRFGAIEVQDDGRDLAELARQAYLAVFNALHEADGGLHMLRLWNYVPHINQAAQGLERYRQFNIGRQQAFVESGQDAFEGAPAACALGTPGGPLCIRFLAGRAPALPVENPRQVSAYRYSTEFGPRSPTFSRAALAEVGGGELALFISGTASVVGEQSVHAGDVGAQLQETLTNLDAVLRAAQGATTARFTLAACTCVIYLRHAHQLDAVRSAFEGAVGRASHAAASAVYMQADICRSDLLLEIEGHVQAPGTWIS